jgi:hypothetical protein
VSPIVQFTLASLQDLDGGKAVKAFEQHVRRAAIDCMDRPADATARKVVLELELTPVMDQAGECTEVNARFKAASAVPKHQTKLYSLGLRRNGVLVFNPDSPDHIDQTTFLSDQE